MMMMMMMMMMTTKKIQEEEKEKPNPGGPEGGGGVVGSTSATPPPPPPGGGPDDRISELPVEILHHILGFLEMDDFMIGTSLVSTKWRNLWKSVSTLNFPNCTTDDDGDDDSVVDNGGVGGIRNNVEKYQNFVDHVLRLRDSQASKIQIFRYCFDDFNSRVSYDDYLERLHNFIVSAVVNQGAQHILVKGRYASPKGIMSKKKGNRIHFNPSIFNSALLRKFDFTVFNRHYLIQFPRSMCCATHLTHLSLWGIRLPEGDESNDELHLVCPLLETFHMRCCYSEHLKVLDISAPRLNSLSIDNCGMRRRHFDGLGGCRLEIRTPNLTSLDYSGCVYVDCFTENLPHVYLADLDFTKEPDMVEQTNSFAIKLLKGLTSADVLILAGFEPVFSQDTLSDLLTPFTSLRTLKLTTNCNTSSIHGMVHFLNNCNSLRLLLWDVDEIRTVEDDDEHLMLPQCRLSHLKYVRIKNLHGHKNEIEFLKFLLKSSVVLEGLIINTTKNSPKRLLIEENLKQFIEEEPSVRRSIKLYVLEEES